MITQNEQMAAIIHLDYTLLTVLNRFGIMLGFGNKTIQQVCDEQNIDVNFFLTIINTFHDKDYFPREELLKYSIELLVSYLQKSHYEYNNIKIPRIKKLIDSLQWTDGQQNNHAILKNFFEEYRSELKTHTGNEEDTIFPYVLDVEKALISNSLSNELKARLSNYSIEDYLSEHSDIEEKLLDLKNIIIKFLPPADNYEVSSAIISELFILESDLNDHSKIEEKVMVPKIKEMEKAIVAAISHGN